MKDALAELLARYGAQDPPMTLNDLEKEIAHCVSMKINEIAQEVITGDTISAFKNCAEKHGLNCEIAPALSLFVSVRQADIKIPMREELFSSLTLDDSMQMILDNAEQAQSSAELIAWVRDAMNLACSNFLNAVVVRHPLALRIFQILAEKYNLTVNIAMRSPIQLLTQSLPDAPLPVRPGMYI